MSTHDVDRDRQLPGHESNWKIMNCPITTIYLLVRPPLLWWLPWLREVGSGTDTLLSIYPFDSANCTVKYSWTNNTIVIVRVMNMMYYHQSHSPQLGPIISMITGFIVHRDDEEGGGGIEEGVPSTTVR